MLQVKHLSLYHRRDLSALVEDISFSLGAGERLALIGEEGNGKSTLLRAIAGDASIHDYIEMSGEIVCRWRIGYLPQELPGGDRARTAYDFFSQSPSFFDQTPNALARLAARLRLPVDALYSDQRMGDFSGGERVKLQMARILMDEPQLLLLDEPSNDIDADTLVWLEDFMLTCGLPILFVSHDETLLGRAATGVVLLERLRRRTVPRGSVCRMDYESFVAARADLFAKQEQVARKEREEQAQRMARYETIRRKVERDQNAISRQNPAGGRLLKKKMHAVMSMGRRFEREAQAMTAMPEQEEAIFAKLDCKPLAPGKVVLDLTLPQLCIEGRTLARDVRLMVRGRDKLCIMGPNGAGKSTLLRAIRDALAARADLRVFYMPQDAMELLDAERTPIDMLAPTGEKAARDVAGVALGSMKFTGEEMNHPCAALSGGQRAKLMFLMMANAQADVLLLDEPTRNLSPLSGPVVRALFAQYPGCIIAVSHDRRFAGEICTWRAQLSAQGLREADDGAL